MTSEPETKPSDGAMNPASFHWRPCPNPSNNFSTLAQESKTTFEPETKPSSGAKNRASFQWRPCANPGNPVFSCMMEPKTLTTSNFLTKPQLLLYKTTSSEYGAIPPTTQMVPCKFCPKDKTFTDRMFACGMTRFNGINTGTDKTKVFDHSDLMHTL